MHQLPWFASLLVPEAWHSGQLISFCAACQMRCHLSSCELSSQCARELKLDLAVSQDLGDARQLIICHSNALHLSGPEGLQPTLLERQCCATFCALPHCTLPCLDTEMLGPESFRMTRPRNIAGNLLRGPVVAELGPVEHNLVIENQAGGVSAQIQQRS